MYSKPEEEKKAKQFEFEGENLEGTGTSPERSLEERQKDHVKFKTSQRNYLEERVRAQRRLDNLRREFRFVEKLDTKDVSYVLDKKREAAALVVQKNFRRLKAQRHVRDMRMNKLPLEEEIELTEEMKRAIEATKKSVKLHRDMIADNFKTGAFGSNILYRPVNP